MSRKLVVTAVRGNSVLFAVEGPAEDSEGERLWEREFSRYLNWEAHFRAKAV